MDGSALGCLSACCDAIPQANWLWDSTPFFQYLQSILIHFPALY